MKAAMGVWIALLMQDSLGGALKDFDARFKEASGSDRLALIDGLAKYDKPQAAERLAKVFDLIEEGLDAVLPEKTKLLKEGESLPELKNPPPGQLPDFGYFHAIQQWQDHWAREKELGQKIQALLDVRAATIRALSAFRNDDTVATLLRKLRAGTDAEREGVAEALASIEHGDVNASLVERVARDKSWRVRVVAIDALSRRGAKEGLEAVLKALRDPFWQVQMAAVAAVEKFGDPAAIPALIDALKSADGRLKEEINAALAELTGVDKGGSASAWAAWWEAHGEDFRAGLYRAGPEDSAAVRAKLTRFYGIPVPSKRVVFVIDRSGSMLEESGWKPEGGIETGKGAAESERPDGTRKIDVAKFELRRVVRGIPEDTLFTIVAFSEGITPWKETLVAATKKNRDDALAWVQALEASGGTNSYGALRAAFDVKGAAEEKKKDAGADTVFFMSDGRPSAGELTEPAQILERVAEWNKVRKIKINTIAVGQEGLPSALGGGGVDPEFLKKLADMTGGFHVWRK